MDEQRIEQWINDLEGDVSFHHNFSKLLSICYYTAQIKGWHDPKKSFGEQILMMHSELSEVIEAYRTKDGDTQSIWFEPVQVDIYDKDACTTVTKVHHKPEGVPVELADVLIRMGDTTKCENLSLLGAFFLKSRFNLTRPRRHGDKKL